MKIFSALLLLSIAQASADNWDDGVPLSIPRAGASAVTYEGKIYVLGGKSLNNRVLNTVEVFDSTTNTWDTTQVTPFQKARYNAAAIVWQNKIYLIGGRNNDKVLKSVEVYDPVQNEWGKAHGLREEREGHSAGIVNNHIYCFGGQKNNYELLEHIEWYDPEKDEWNDEFDMEYPRSALFSAIKDDTIFTFGGAYFGGVQAESFKSVYADSEFSWLQIDSLSTGRAYGASAQIDSLVYLIGGETTMGKTKLVEIFNLNSGHIYHGTDMPDAQSGMASAVLGGKIYVIGGYQSGENDVEGDVHILTPAITALAVKKPHTPRSLLLARAYPNPFNGYIKLDVEIPLSGDVQIDILNMLGQKIIRLHDGALRSGKYTFHWNAHSASGRDISSGMYLLTIRAGRLSKRIKLVYVK